MALDYKNPSEVAADYIQVLEALQPQIAPVQSDSTWWISGQVLGGVVSGLYADQQAVDGDIFPQTARLAALQRMLVTYGLAPQIQPQPADGNILVNGTLGTVYTAGLQFQNISTGNVYQATSGVTLTGSTGFLPAVSVATGSNQNALPGTPLVVLNPPAGSTTAASIIAMSDGRDLETQQEIATRVLARIQFPPQGGTVTDYEAWAFAADPSVTSANIVRFVYGPGTVGVYISAGTTNISEAVTEGIPIVRVPSTALVAEVQAYINTQNPITDCAHVFAVQEVAVDVTVNVALTAGLSLTSVVQGQTLSCSGLIVQEISRALYLIPAGGRQIKGEGYVLKSELEEALDVQLGNTIYDTGALAQIILDRTINDLSATGPNIVVAQQQIFKPSGNIIVLATLD